MEFFNANDSREVSDEKLKTYLIGYGILFLSIAVGGWFGMGENSIDAAFFTLPITFYIFYKRSLKAKEGIDHEK